jgi:Protein of unknown function (DUF3105)
VLALPWRSKFFRLGRAAGCCLGFIASCGDRRPVGPISESDAAGDGATSGGSADSGRPPLDAGAVEADAADGGAASASDAGGSLADGISGEPGDAADATANPDDSSSVVDVASSEPVGPCHAVVEPHAIEGYNHVGVCSHVTYLTKPPSSGDHYPIWASYQSYASAIPEGFWVHNLEHGAVVVSYNCPGGCASDVAAAQSWMDSLPDDPACNPSAGDARIRMIMTPDPNLDVEFAASAWGWTLRADCFDAAAFAAFVQGHYGQGREVICSQGQDLSLGVQEGCGE